MPRFSSKVKEIHDSLRYKLNMEKANQLQNKLSDPLDIAISELFIAYYNLYFQQLTLFLKRLNKVEDINKALKDKFVQFITNCHYYSYYNGMNNPTVSKGQAEKYLESMEKSYEELDCQDDWEKFYCSGLYYLMRAQATEDSSKAIQFQKQCIKAFSLIPEDGKYYSASGYNNLGLYYLRIGNFQEAENSFNIALDIHENYANRLQLLPLSNLMALNYMKGNLGQTKDLIERGIEIAKRYKDIFGISNYLSYKGICSFQEAKYDEAIKEKKESLKYRIQYGDPLHLFWGYFDIFDFYYKRYKMTNDDVFLTEAENVLIDLQKLSSSHPDNKTMKNYNDFGDSLIWKHGNIKKRAKAMNILENLLEIYPNEIRFSLNLLELLFDDVLQSEDQDTIQQIDDLMARIGKIPLRTNPEAVIGYSSQQIFLAKYNYYIRGDPGLAIEILRDTKDDIKNYNLNQLVNELDRELEVLEKELTKWDNLDISIKERIKAAKFGKYVQQAIQLKNSISEI